MHYYLITEKTGGADERERADNVSRSLDTLLGPGEVVVPDLEQHPTIKTPSWWRPGTNVEDVDVLANRLHQRGR